MVPKQCPFRRPTFWYLVCCATCLGSRDNSKYHTCPHTWPKSDFHRLFDSGFAPSALSLRLNHRIYCQHWGIDVDSMCTLNRRWYLNVDNQPGINQGPDINILDLTSILRWFHIVFGRCQHTIQWSGRTWLTDQYRHNIHAMLLQCRNNNNVLVGLRK